MSIEYILLNSLLTFKAFNRLQKKKYKKVKNKPKHFKAIKSIKYEFYLRFYCFCFSFRLEVISFSVKKKMRKRKKPKRKFTVKGEGVKVYNFFNMCLSLLADFKSK